MILIYDQSVNIAFLDSLRFTIFRQHTPTFSWASKVLNYERRIDKRNSVLTVTLLKLPD